MHVLKDCNNHTLGHELVPIITMNNQVLPDNIGDLQIPTDDLLPMPSSLKIMGGVYTLPEEPELETEDNTTM